MRRSAVFVSAAAVCSLLVATLPAASALAAPQRGRSAILTIKKLGGTAVKPGAILEGSLAKHSIAAFTTTNKKGAPGVFCSQVSFKDKVIKNPLKPGKSTESLIAQTFKPKSCTAKGIPGTTGAVKSVTVAIPKRGLATSISDSKGDPVVVQGTRATLTLATTLAGGDLACTYAANRNTTLGHALNKAQSITFTLQPFHLVSGPPNGCPHSGFFSATFAPVKDFSVKGDPAVFVN